MIVGDVTYQISVVINVKENVPCRLVVWLISNVQHVFAKTIKNREELLPDDLRLCLNR